MLYAYFCYLMVEISLQYIPYHTDVAFLRIKQDYIRWDFYRLSFFIHAYCAVLVLPAGFTQFSRYIRQHYPFLHKWNGWLYAIAILVLVAPSGLVLGIFANGGWSSQLGFCLLAVLWFYFTWKAIELIWKKDFRAHQRFMLRSFALTLSAITLRIWKVILVALFHPKPMDVYRWVAWLGWLVNLIIIEFIIYKYYQKKA